MPGIIAGGIFTFSLTLGDYIIPQVVGAPGYFIGMMVYTQQGTVGNLPLAAAFSLVPIILIMLYLSMAKRLGAFDAPLIHSVIKACFCSAMRSWALFIYPLS